MPEGTTDALRQLADLNGELRVVNYRLGVLEGTVVTRAEGRDVDELKAELAHTREKLESIGRRVTDAETSVTDKMNRRDNIRLLLVALVTALATVAAAYFTSFAG